MSGFTIVKYALGIMLDSAFETRSEPVPYLDQVLAKHGECDNDVILEIENNTALPLYRWCKEKSSWQMIQ